MKIETPLAAVRGLGSAKSGTEHWWLQRVTAVANLPLVILAASCIVYHLGASRAEVVASFGNPFVAIPFALAFISVLWHMRLGMQAIIEDYVHGTAAKFICLLLNNFYAASLGGAAGYAVLKMSLAP
jgi:succinate dehydrogenase / fumarate reductase membrane anchor subunit